jgi:hypothetical protein
MDLPTYNAEARPITRITEMNLARITYLLS